MKNLTAEKILKSLMREYKTVMDEYMKDVKTLGYMGARAKWDRTIIAIENIVEAFDLELVYDIEAKAVTIREM